MINGNVICKWSIVTLHALAKNPKTFSIDQSNQVANMDISQRSFILVAIFINVIHLQSTYLTCIK